MARLLLRGKNNTHPDPDIDRIGCYKRGMPVVAKEDDHVWGLGEMFPNFVSIDFPEVPVNKILKYIEPEYSGIPTAEATTYRRRLWQLRWSDLPVAARNILALNSCLVIKVGDYTGPYDYTWQQIKGFFRNLKTDLDETEDL